ncbi:MAG: AAA family ATPase, partial [Candidatus Omnitrophota bacterium]
MIINEMTIKNFKQFLGEHTLRFANDPKKSVTVIYGANGRGKTSLYRAIMFCLYGEKRLAQDPDESSEELQLVNKVAVEKAGERESVEAFVQLEFVHNNEKFTLRRAASAIRASGAQHEQIGEVSLSSVSGGNSHIERDVVKVDEKINTILNKRVREYFLFDGEKIERLTRIDRSQKREIEIGIKNLLNIDQLTIAKEGFELLLRSMENQLRAKSTGAYQQEILKLQTKEQEIKKVVGDLDRFDSEIQSASVELKMVDQKLDGYKDIAVQLARRTEVQTILETSQKRQADLLGEMIVGNDDVGVLLVEEEILRVGKVIQEKIRRGELPSPIRELLVNKILEEGVCVCKTDLRGDPEKMRHILEWKNKVIDEKIEENLFQTYKNIGGATEFIQHKTKEVRELLQSYSTITEQIEQCEKNLKIISEQIGEQKVDDNIPLLEQTRNSTYEKKIRLEQSYTDGKNKLLRLQEELKIIKDSVAKLEKEESVR